VGNGQAARAPKNLVVNGSQAKSFAKSDALLPQKYRELTRKHLSRFLGRLFTEFTDLHFHVAWAPTASRDWDARALPTGCSMCCRLAGTSLAAQQVCQACGPRQLVRALNENGEGLGFKCRLGVLNYWLPVCILDQTIGIAYLQALDGAQPGQTAQRRSGRAATKVVTQSEFRRAGQLLRLMIQHVQTLNLADLSKEALTKARRALRVFENVQMRLRKKLNGVLPALRETPPVLQPECRRERIAQAVLNRIHQDYARPLTLRKCASDLGMNAAYLSDLFSRTVGLSFKTCLTEVRMEKARELLSDPATNISQVASAVGYASGNRFRIAFRNVTGLAPRMWRETLQMNSQHLTPSFS